MINHTKNDWIVATLGVAELKNWFIPNITIDIKRIFIEKSR